MDSREPREQLLAEWAARVRKRGEFVHLDHSLPRLASGDYMPRDILVDLVYRGVLVVSQSDLLGRPLQYAVKRATRRIAR